jgi:hypothetical protein
VKLALNRCWLTEKSTIGKLIIDEVFECWTLEDHYRGDDMSKKVARETAIPCGTYQVVITHSQRFGVEMPLLLNVPGFSGIRIHPGNTSKDTEGCVLVGHTRGPDQILGSRVAYESLFAKLKKAQGPIEITVRLTPHL